MVGTPSHTPSRGPSPVRESFTEEPQLSVRYSAHSWREQQSVIDILQNHLDANERNGVEGPPRLSVRLTKVDSPETEKWVRLDRIDQSDAAWTVTGLRVHDKGAGFDPGYLGLLGATTKEHDPKSRGGLGEGLKMSVVNLMRLGAGVRLASVSKFASWAASGKLVDDTLVFEGRRANLSQAESFRINHGDYRSGRLDVR